MILSQLYYIIYQSCKEATQTKNHGARIMSQTEMINKRSIGQLHLIGILKGQWYQKYIIIGVMFSPDIN